MKFDELLKLIVPERREAFLCFVETGEADHEFLAYIDADHKAQQAVEMAFTAQAAAFGDVAQALRASEHPRTSEERTATVSANMTLALEKALDLAPEERKDAIERTATTLRATTDAEQRRALRSIVQDIERHVLEAPV